MNFLGLLITGGHTSREDFNTFWRWLSSQSLGMESKKCLLILLIIGRNPESSPSMSNLVIAEASLITPLSSLDPYKK